MPSKGWRTVRCVVELPVRGDFSEKKLSLTVERLLTGLYENMQVNFELMLESRLEAKQLEIGTPRIKEYGRHVRANERMIMMLLGVAHEEVEQLRTLKRASEVRIERLFAPRAERVAFMGMSPIRRTAAAPPPPASPNKKRRGTRPPGASRGPRAHRHAPARRPRP